MFVLKCRFRYFTTLLIAGNISGCIVLFSIHICILPLALVTCPFILVTCTCQVLDYIPGVSRIPKIENVYCKYQRLYSMVATVYKEGNSRKVFQETDTV